VSRTPPRGRGMEEMTDQHKGYGERTARRVLEVYRTLQQLEDVVTISAVARRSRVSRSTARTVLRQECGWTPAQSRRAHRAGIKRGQLVQAVAGHPSLVRGRQTLELQGWPHLHEAHSAFADRDYPALQRGRATQAAQGWAGLVAAQTSQAVTGYSHLNKGRANLAAREWPNWKKAKDILKEQDYVPLLEAQRRRSGADSRQLNDRRFRRARSTRLAIVEALHVLLMQKQFEGENDRGGRGKCGLRVTGREIAAYLHLHPTTVNGHLKTLRAVGIIDQKNLPL
jgi:DNA-binding transcriptional ArsR family regulator